MGLLLATVLHGILTVDAFEKFGERRLVGEMKQLADILNAIICGLQEPAGLEHQVAVDECRYGAVSDLLRHHRQVTRRDVQLLCVEGDVVSLSEMLTEDFAELYEQLVSVLRGEVFVGVALKHSHGVGEQ